MAKAEAKKYICKQIDNLTFEDLRDVFELGRREYGGEFDVESIPCVAELFKEAADSTLYVTFLRHFQREH